MRVFVRDRHIHLQWWDGKQNRRKSLGLEFEGDTTSKDWWKKTKYAKEIRDAIRALENKKFAERIGLPVQRVIPESISLIELLSLYNETNRMEAGEKTPETLLHRKHAVQFALKFRNVTARELDRDFFLGLRSWAEQQGYAPASIRGYFTEWRALADFGIRKGYIRTAEHPVRGIRIAVHYAEPIPTRPEDEQLFFTYCYHNHRHLFRQLLFLRLSGARKRASTRLKREWVDLERGMWFHDNTKAHRQGWIPMQTPLRLLFEDSLTESEFVFHYRNGKTLWYATERVCEFLGIPNINPHQWKANYLAELDDEDISDRLLTLAAHHAPHGESSVVSTHYSRSRKRLLTAMESAQEHWVEFYRKLPSTKWEGAVLQIDKQSLKPPAVVLEKLLAGNSAVKVAATLGVSDTTIANWADSYGIKRAKRAPAPQPPSEEILAALLSEFSMVEIAKRFGVSDHTVARWAECYGLRDRDGGRAVIGNAKRTKELETHN